MKIYFKYIALLLSFVIITQSLQAQITLKGTLQDSSKTPIAFCAMALLKNADSSLYKGNMSNEKGEFTFESVKPGNYLIKIVQVGSTPFFSQAINIDTTQHLIELPTFTLNNKSIHLNEVSVSVFKPLVEFKKGITVLNVENNLIANGNTVIELLKRIPGITIDNQNNIFINGKSGVRFLINGRLQYLNAEQMLNVLNGMSAENIANIELIKNPPSKYDAAGTAGLINIVLKKGKLKGWNGSLYNLTGKGYYFRNTSILNLNFKSNKFSLFSNITYMDLNLMDNYKFYRSIYSNINEVINEDGKDLIHKLIVTGNLGLEYDLNKNTTLGLNMNAGPNQSNHNQQSVISIPSGTAFTYAYLTSKSSINENFNNPSLNINATHKFDTIGTQLIFTADYTNFLGNENKLNENRFYNPQDVEILTMYANKSITKRDFRIFTQKIDFTKPLKNNFGFDAGIKTSFASNKNNFTLLQTDNNTNFYLDTEFSNIYQYNEQILAAYSSLNKSYKKLNLQAGVRAEQTNINAINKTNSFQIKRDYLNIFPSASIDYRLNDKLSIQSQYSYRIDRADYMSLNPLKVFWDKLDYRAGNPFLMPQYSHNLNVDFNYKGSFINSLGFIQTNNSFFSYSYSNNETKINTDTLVNIGQRNNLSYSLFLQKQIKWYNFQINGIALYRNFIGKLSGEDANSQSFFYSVSMNHEFKLPKEFKIQVFAVYNSPIQESLQLYRQSSSVNLAIQKNFYDKKLSVSIGFHDIFYQEIFGITTTFSNQNTYFYMKNDTRRIRLTINYKFGKMKFEQKTLRSNDDESNRLKSSGK